MIWRLLFIHGQLSAYRMGFFISFFFYKNFLIFFQQLFYSFYCCYSGLPFFNLVDALMYNGFFTCIPIIYFAIFDQDFNILSKHMNLKNLPLMYEERREKMSFSMITYLKFFILGFGQSVILFFIIYFYIELSAFQKQGMIVGHFFRTFVSFFATVLTQFVVICLRTKHWTLITLGVYSLTGLLFFFPAWTFIFPFHPIERDIILYMTRGGLYLGIFQLLISSTIFYYLFTTIEKFFLTRNFNEQKIENSIQEISNPEK